MAERRIDILYLAPGSYIAPGVEIHYEGKKQVDFSGPVDFVIQQGVTVTLEELPHFYMDGT